jgi:hypothetical protein
MILAAALPNQTTPPRDDQQQVTSPHSRRAWAVQGPDWASSARNTLRAYQSVPFNVVTVSTRNSSPNIRPFRQNS